MKILKGYVKNRARPEGCIAKCYLVDETITFCNGYFKHDFGGNDQNARNQDFFSNLILEGHPILGGKSMSLSDEVLERAHRYVLFNTTVTEPFLQMNLEELKQSNKNLERYHNLLQKAHANNFATWLKEKAPPRGYYELEMYNEDEDLTSRPEYVTTRNMNIYDDSEEVSYVRDDCEGLLTIALNGDPLQQK
ncbi:hypothetical protein Patl1_05561 [Pistacia atlantica]|uniref:Uncharacterized protein n=1 Tax=Pistacia atlantica TaxID=434234 RepID=A0ACC1BVF2_9ROSI|nr:hypothetical protein Patl1_05561 [Pistacia atlantica]